MAGMAHNLFIEHAIAISRSHETGAQAVGADGLLPFAIKAGLPCSHKQDRAQCIVAEAANFDRPALLILRNRGPRAILLA